VRAWDGVSPVRKPGSQDVAGGVDVPVVDAAAARTAVGAGHLLRAAYFMTG